MDAVTYPHPDVARALESWAVGRFDVAANPRAPRLLAIEAVPSTVALRADGRILERRVGFVEPLAFTAWLTRLAAEIEEDLERYPDLLQHFASGPLRDPRIVAASLDFVPVFVDTLDRAQPYARFGESYGSYPVLRVHDHAGRELAGRLDGNAVRGEIPADEVLAQLERGRAAFASR
jgi:hypothetical protein